MTTMLSQGCSLLQLIYIFGLLLCLPKLDVSYGETYSVFLIACTMDVAEITNESDFILRAFQDGSREVTAFPKDPDARTNFKHYTVDEIRQLTIQAAAYYDAHGIRPRKKGEKPSIVGISTYSSIEWLATYYALVLQSSMTDNGELTSGAQVLMGHTVLILSSRLSKEVVEILLQNANANVLVYEPKLWPNEPSFDTGIPIVTSEQLEPFPAMTQLTLCEQGTIDPDTDVVSIALSSGSTGVPKLLPQTHRNSVGRSMWIAKHTMTPSKRQWIAATVYNSVGLGWATALLFRTTPLIFDHDRVPVTAENLIATIREFRPQSTFTTSYFIEKVMSHPDGLSELSQFENILHFGAMLPKAIGDQLARAQCRFGSAMGTTETGYLLNSTSRPKDDFDWDWLYFITAKAQHLTMKAVARSAEDDRQLYELIVLASCPNIIPAAKRSDDPPGSVHTGDLFLEHPTKKGRYKIVGRKDDQLKIYQQAGQTMVNALVYEEKIKSGNEEKIDDVVLFGAGRAQLGALVFAETASTPDSKEAVLTRAWSSIEHEINSKLKVGIDKNMIIVVSGLPTVLLPRTPKLNFIRAQVYLKYKDAIDAAYGSNAGEGAVDGGR